MLAVPPAVSPSLIMQPVSGGRLEARLAASDAAGARYAVELSSPAGVWNSEVDVAAADGEVRWQGWSSGSAAGGEPPEWLCRYLRAALRSAWRALPEDGWPRRLTRWREAPDPRRSSPGESQ
jgi:hypothetical protein